MIKLIKFIILALFWLQAFVAPVILFGLIGFAFGKENLLYVLLVIGAITGIILAEYIRRRFGLDTFFARIYGSNDMDKKIKKED